MKRFMILTLMVAVLLIAGCGGGVKTYVDAEKTIITSIEQEFVIALDSNPTTGYDWEESYDDNMLSLIEKEYSPDEKAPGLVGAGGTQYFTFKALKKGKTEILVDLAGPSLKYVKERKAFSVNIE